MTTGGLIRVGGLAPDAGALTSRRPTAATPACPTRAAGRRTAWWAWRQAPGASTRAPPRPARPPRSARPPGLAWAAWATVLTAAPTVTGGPSSTPPGGPDTPTIRRRTTRCHPTAPRSCPRDRDASHTRARRSPRGPAHDTNPAATGASGHHDSRACLTMPEPPPQPAQNHRAGRIAARPPSGAAPDAGPETGGCGGAAHGLGRSDMVGLFPGLRQAATLRAATQRSRS